MIQLQKRIHRLVGLGALTLAFGCASKPEVGWRAIPTSPGPNPMGVRGYNGQVVYITGPESPESKWCIIEIGSGAISEVSKTVAAIAAKTIPSEAGIHFLESADGKLVHITFPTQGKASEAFNELVNCDSILRLANDGSVRILMKR